MVNSIGWPYVFILPGFALVACLLLAAAFVRDSPPPAKLNECVGGNGRGAAVDAR